MSHYQKITPEEGKAFDMNSIHQKYWGMVCHELEKGGVKFEGETSEQKYQSFVHLLYSIHEMQNGDSERLVLMPMFFSHGLSLNAIRSKLEELPSPLNLEELQAERDELKATFSETPLGKLWLKDIGLRGGMRSMAKYIAHHSDMFSERELHDFFYQLDKLSIMEDILRGNAARYGIELEYPEGWLESEEPVRKSTLSAADEKLVGEVLDFFVPEGKVRITWERPATQDGMRCLLRTLLGEDTRLLEADDADQTVLVRNIFTKVKGGKQATDFEIGCALMVGYFMEKGYMKCTPTEANKLFDRKKDMINCINKGRGKKGKLPDYFLKAQPFIDKYLEKVLTDTKNPSSKPLSA